MESEQGQDYWFVLSTFKEFDSSKNSSRPALMFDK